MCCLQWKEKWLSENMERLRVEGVPRDYLSERLRPTADTKIGSFFFPGAVEEWVPSPSPILISHKSFSRPSFKPGLMCPLHIDLRCVTTEVEWRVNVDAPLIHLWANNGGSHRAVSLCVRVSRRRGTHPSYTQWRCHSADSTELACFVLEKTDAALSHLCLVCLTKGQQQWLKSFFSRPDVMKIALWKALLRPNSS